MYKKTTRLTGIILLISSVWGLGLSFFGLYGLWYIKPSLVANISDVLALAVKTMEVIDGMIQTTSESLTDAGYELVLMQKILQDTGDTIGLSTATVDGIAKLLGEKMPQFINETQQALEGTQTTARLIDDTLGTFVSIPFIGPYLGQRYKPEIPLSESIAKVNQSLDPLTSSFKTIQSDMNSASAGIETVRSDILVMAMQIEKLKSSLEDAKNKVDQYHLISTDLQDRLNQLVMILPGFIDKIAFGITFVLFWFGVSQFGALLIAVEHIIGSNRV